MRRGHETELSARPTRARASTDAAAQAFEQGEPRRALNLLPARRDGHGWHLAARVHASLGQHARAARAYREAQRRQGSLPLALEAARHALTFAEEDRPLLADVVKRLRAARRRCAPEEGLAAAVLEARALNQLGDFQRSLELVDEVCTEVPASPELLLEAGMALFECCRFEEAQTVLEQVVRTAPEEGWAFHHLGVLAERQDDLRAARKLEDRARALLGRPRAIRLTPAGFEEVVRASVARLPAVVQRHLAGVPMRIEPFPSEAELRATRPPLSPAILGLFKGPPLGASRGEREILLFQRNLERHCDRPGELGEQVALTLLHEVGHLLGLDEAALWARGLE